MKKKEGFALVKLDFGNGWELVDNNRYFVMGLQKECSQIFEFQLANNDVVEVYKAGNRSRPHYSDFGCVVYKGN